MPSSKDRRRLEVPEYLHQQVQQIAVREGRTVASVVNELLHSALRTYRTSWIPGEHLQLFNDRARHALDLATEEARSFNHHYIGTEHLLLGLLAETESSAAQFLARHNIDHARVRGAVEHHIKRGTTPSPDAIEFVPRARRALGLAVDEARALGHQRIGTDHLLIGLIHEGEGVAVGLLERLGLDLAQVEQRRLTILSQGA